MGLETALFIGMTAFKAMSTIKTAKAEAKAVAQEGELAAKNKAQQVAMKAGAIQTSFLNSGLTLEGTPMSAINSTFNTGLEDINQIRSNANTKSKNIMSNARSQVIQDIAGSVAGASFGGSSTFNPITSNLPVGKYGGGFGYYGSSNTRIDWFK